MNRCFTNLLLCNVLALICLGRALIHPADNFNASTDAAILERALNLNDKGAITDVVTRRNAEQRLAIVKAYDAEFKRNLVEDFEDKLSHNYRNLMVAMMEPLSEYYAKELRRDSRYFFQTGAAVDILTTTSYADLKAVSEAHTRLEPKSIYDLKEIVLNHYQGLESRVVGGAFKGLRNETQEVDVAAAIADAKVIHDIGEGIHGFNRHFNHERTVEGIFITRSHRQMRQIFEEYNTLYNHGIEKAFKGRGWSGKTETSFLNMIDVFKSIPNYYASRLFKSMDGPGTTDKVLIRVIVGRSEIDLDEIREAFQTMYGSNLTAMITGDTSGEYRRAILAIVNS